MNKMGKNTLFQAILVMAGMLTACGGSSQKDEKEQVKYEIQVMKPESRVYNLYIPAALHGVSEVEVFPQVSGIIREVNFKDLVTKNKSGVGMLQIEEERIAYQRSSYLSFYLYRTLVLEKVWGKAQDMVAAVIAFKLIHCRICAGEQAVAVIRISREHCIAERS